MKKLFEKWKDLLTISHGVREEISSVSQRLTPTKSRPSHLARREYVPLEREGEVVAYFERLQNHMIGESQKRIRGRAPRFRAEHGRLPEKRSYFYIAPWNEAGWLFERTPTGWVISQAEKIVERQTFLRRYEPWDVVTLMAPEEGNGLIRVSSRRFGNELLSFPLYEEALGRYMGISTPE